MSILLSHEVAALKAMEASLGDENKYLISEKADEQSHNYDWHDNAPLDVINQAMRMNSNNIRKVQQLLEDARVVDYPKAGDACIRLGSLVVGRAAFGLLPFVVVGQTHSSKQPYLDMWKQYPLEDIANEDLTVITPASPIGKAAFGVAMGATVSYLPNEKSDRNISLTIERIDQLWVAAHFSQQ